jgi:hypothetical protein
MSWKPLTAPTATVCVAAAALGVLVTTAEVELGTKDEPSKAVARTLDLNNIVNLKASVSWR